MRRKQLAKRVAIAVLSAATVMTAAPVGTFAATNVVSVDASDAATVDSPKDDPNNDTDTTGIINELSGATVTAGTDDKAAVAGAKENWSVASTVTYSYVVTSVSDITFKAKDDGSDLESAKVTLTLSVVNNTTHAPKGTAQITVDLLKDTETTRTNLKFTAAQKVAAVKTVLEAKAKAEGDDAITYVNGDNVASLATKLGISGLKIADDTKLDDVLAVNTDNSTNGAHAGASAVTVDISVGTITDATSTTEGSVPYTISYKAAQYDAKGNKTDVTDSSFITGKIAKTKGQNDAAYAQKIQNAISAATWTSDDIKKDVDGKATGLTAEGKAKLVNIIKAVDDNTNAKVTYKADGTPDKFVGFGKTPDDAKETDVAKASDTPDATVSRFTDGKHGKDGFAHIQFFASRMDGKAANVVDSFDVDITIKEGESNVKKELASAFKSGVLAASKSLKATSVASQADAVKVITDAIDKELANSYNGKTYASDIKSYEVVVPKDDYTQAGTQTKGSIKFYIKVDTGRTSASDPTTTDIWYFRTNIANTEDDFATKVGTTPATTFTSVTDKAAAEAAGDKDSTLAYIKDLKEVSKVDAASVSLPSEVSYNVNIYGDAKDKTFGTGLKVKDILTITPKTANHWTIRVTNSNNTAYVVKKSDGTSYTAPVLNTEKDVEKLPTIILKDKAKPASTTLKVDLLDDDGNVISTTSTTITVKKGFDDVQNPSYFAYDPVNALASTVKLEKDTTVKKAKKYKTNGNRNDNYWNLTVKEGTKLTASPVIAGIGNNKFDPYADVTRGQFITFLWRNAVNEYSFADATTQAYTKDPASYTGKTDFADVDAKAYYAKAVEWAAKNGIAFGSDATHFNPNKTITRAEAVSFIYRLKAQGAVYNNYQQFDDVSSSAYYANAVGYARSEGITAGKSGTKFAPNDTVTRGEAAAFIYRMAAGEDGFYYDAYDAVEVTP